MTLTLIGIWEEDSVQEELEGSKRNEQVVKKRLRD